MSKAVQLKAATAVLLVALDSLERDGRPEARAVRTALDLLDPEPTAEARRSKGYRERQRARARDGDTLSSRSVTVASRDEGVTQHVTRHGRITQTPVVGLPSALPSSESPSPSASSAEEISEEGGDAREVASRSVTPNVTPQSHVRPIVPRPSDADDVSRDTDAATASRAVASERDRRARGEHGLPEDHPVTRGAREPMPGHLARCPGCGCAASRVERQRVALHECCWCGACYFADGRLSPRRVKVAEPPRSIPLDASGAVVRTPW